jgi:hypothetical protein
MHAQPPAWYRSWRGHVSRCLVAVVNLCSPLPTASRLLSYRRSLMLGKASASVGLHVYTQLIVNTYVLGLWYKLCLYLCCCFLHCSGGALEVPPRHFVLTALPRRPIMQEYSLLIVVEGVELVLLLGAVVACRSVLAVCVPPPPVGGTTVLPPIGGPVVLLQSACALSEITLG